MNKKYNKKQISNKIIKKIKKKMWNKIVKKMKKIKLIWVKAKFNLKKKLIKLKVKLKN